MLVLTRKKGQGIQIDDEVTITVLEIKGDSIKIGIEAPKGISILRSELIQEVRTENQKAVNLNREALKGLGNFFKNK